MCSFMKAHAPVAARVLDPHSSPNQTTIASAAPNASPQLDSIAEHNRRSKTRSISVAGAPPNLSMASGPHNHHLSLAGEEATPRQEQWFRERASSNPDSKAKLAVLERIRQRRANGGKVQKQRERE